MIRISELMVAAWREGFEAEGLRLWEPAAIVELFSRSATSQRVSEVPDLRNLGPGVWVWVVPTLVMRTGSDPVIKSIDHDTFIMAVSTDPRDTPDDEKIETLVGEVRMKVIQESTKIEFDTNFN